MWTSGGTYQHQADVLLFSESSEQWSSHHQCQLAAVNVFLFFSDIDTAKRIDIFAICIDTTFRIDTAKRIDIYSVLKHRIDAPHR